jgi:hypothetical protein
MIILSRSRAKAAAFTVLVASSLMVGSCSQRCTAIGCEEGLTIEFRVDADGGVPATGDLDIAIEIEELQQFVPIMTCVMTVAGTRQLLCASTYDHRTGYSNVIIRDNRLERVRVTVSGAGTQISQQTFTLEYTSSEINGEGCGVCTRAGVVVEVP